MIQRGNGAGLTLKTIAVFDMQRFDGDGASQPNVGGFVNLAHAARADGEFRTGRAFRLRRGHLRDR
jgi:hypothetical protein